MCNVYIYIVYGSHHNMVWYIVQYILTKFFVKIYKHYRAIRSMLVELGDIYQRYIVIWNFTTLLNIMILRSWIKFE